MKKDSLIQLKLLHIERVVVFFTVLFIVGIELYLVRAQLNQKRLEGPAAPESTTLEQLQVQNATKTVEEEQSGLSLNIDMPFFSQAPFGNWDYPWQEACEEASVILVANLYLGMHLDAENFNNELLSLVDWEVANFGAYEHTTVAQTIEMMERQYGLIGIVHKNPTFEDIQDILNRGHLIIAPFAGQLLGNPNFRNGGPIYHMLVIKGYNVEKMQVVTHDVGTQNGADYVYDWSVIENALHDWHDANILLGEKLIIEVLP